MSPDLIASSGAGGIVIIYLAVVVLSIAGMWTSFAKAKLPGWGAIIPFYNGYLFCKLGKRPGWWLILLCIPLVNIVILAIVSFDVAKNFGKGTGFGFGLWLLPIIFWPILGFGSAAYAEVPTA